MWTALVILTLGAGADDLAGSMAALKETMRAELRRELRAEMKETMRAEMGLLFNKLRSELQTELVGRAGRPGSNSGPESLSIRRLQEDDTAKVITDVEVLGEKVAEMENKLIDRGLISDSDAKELLLGHRHRVPSYTRDIPHL